MTPFRWQEGRQPRRLLCFSAAFFMVALVFSLLVSQNMELLPAVLYSALVAVTVAAAVIFLLKEQFYLFFSLFLGLLAGTLWCGGYGLLIWQPALQYHGAVGEMRLELTEYAQGKDSYGVAYGFVTALDGQPCRLKVKAYLRDGSPDYGPGDVLTFQGKLESAPRDFRSNLLQEGIFLNLSQETDGTVEPAAAMTLLRRARLLSRSITNTTLDLLPGDEGALMASLLSGEKSHFSKPFDRALITSGTRHVVSVSGMHMTILAGILMNLLGKKNGLLAAIPASLLYSAIVGFSPSVVRATVLLIFWAVAFWLKEEKDSLTSFAAGLLLLLLFAPFSCLSMGLLLSFGATLGLILLSGPINEPLIQKIKTIKCKPLKKVLWYLCGTVSTTLAATLFTTPLTVLFFDSVPLLSLISNLLILWVLSFTMVLGILVLLLQLFIPWTAQFLAAYVLIWPLKWCVFVIKTVGELPFAATDANNSMLLISCILMLAAAVFWLSKRLPGKTLICVTAGLICATMLFTAAERIVFGVIEIENVGGQPVILVRGQGVSLINTGARPQTAADSVQSARSRWNVSALKTVLCTTANYKTQGGLANVLTGISAERILLPGGTVTSALAPYEITTYSASGVVDVSGTRLELLDTGGGQYAFRLLTGNFSLVSLCGIKASVVPDLLKRYDCKADILLLDDPLANDWARLYEICQTVQPRQIVLTTNGYSEHTESFAGIPLTMLQREALSFRFKR